MPTSSHPHARSASKQWWLSLAVVGLIVAASLPARAVQVGDLVRIKGSESSKLVGMGLVVGLKGTGDGGKFMPAIRPLAAVIQRLVDPNVVASELKDAKNVALVTLEATLPSTGVREGDKVDVYLSAIGTAKSLKGGRLFLIPMTGPLPDSPVFAFASGPVSIEDADAPTVGVVKQGAQLTRDVVARFMNEYGQITLVLNSEDAGWANAHAISDLLNQEMAPDGPPLAQATDPKNIIVNLPMWERSNPAAFISRVLQCYMDLSSLNTGARVQINERTQTIIVGADVQISPVVISHGGLTITTITPPPQPSEQTPMVQTNNFVGLDPDRRGGTRLKDLLDAFEQLKVPASERIEIVKELKRIGKLHAELRIE
ncbi:MAG: flagellar basal body P-ring protein FlgI [Phycisphaeraceae bacterium]|nr:flagellar basal body P-ring protein FlgI [Phycisphaeraceae bacterium]